MRDESMNRCPEIKQSINICSCIEPGQTNDLTLPREYLSTFPFSVLPTDNDVRGGRSLPNVQSNMHSQSGWCSCRLAYTGLDTHIRTNECTTSSSEHSRPNITQVTVIVLALLKLGCYRNLAAATLSPAGARHSSTGAAPALTGPLEPLGPRPIATTPFLRQDFSLGHHLQFDTWVCVCVCVCFELMSNPKVSRYRHRLNGQTIVQKHTQICYLLSRCLYLDTFG